jgi:hypothetical protein
MTYSQYKRDLAVRILRRLDVLHHDSSPDYVTRVDEVMKGLDDFLPKDESGKRGTTEFTDLVSVYKVDCPCGAKPEYTDVHPFCPECGCSFN